MLQKINKISLIITILSFVLIFLTFSNAGIDIMYLMVLTIAAFSWIFVSLIRAIKNLFNKRRNKQYSFMFLLIEPITIAIIIALGVYGLYFDIRFNLSKKSLENYATKVLNREIQIDNKSKRIVGLYIIYETDIEDNNVRFITTPEFFSDAGFVYTYKTLLSRVSLDSYIQINGHWYRWHRDANL